MPKIVHNKAQSIIFSEKTCVEQNIQLLYDVVKN